MAIANAKAAPPTPPPSAWIVVVALALVHLALTPMLVPVCFALTPMLVLVRVLCVPAGALACLFFATAFLVFLALAVLLVCVAYVIAVVSGSTSGFKKGEMVGSVMEDVGIFGMHATACVMIPAIVLGLWRGCQADRKAPSQFSFVPRPNSLDGVVPSKLEAAKKHHHLDLNTLGGQTDCITVLDFSSDACNLATGDPLLKEKASYFTNAEKLKVGYTSRTRIRRLSLEW
ncbi:hypothetical protein ZWY2020_021460 [Hordeum vulgare]|nr:hypothetical protein ZWY2020_021460 [Hordeum vulgare]